MNKKLLIIAMAFPTVMLIGCGANDTRMATSELPGEQNEIETEINQPLPVSEVMTAEINNKTGEELIPLELAVDSKNFNEDDAVEIVPTPEILQFYFATNEYELRDDDLTELSVHAKYMISHPGIKLKITGHTDQSGNKEYNRHLAMKRADNVAKILVQKGVMPEQISVYSQGGAQPITGLEHAIRDRRVEFEYHSEMQLSDKQVY